VELKPAIPMFERTKMFLALDSTATVTGLGEYSGSYLQWPRKLTQATCMRVVANSNLVREIIIRFPQSLQTTSGMVPYTRARQLPSTFQLIHY
jgi:hypothetical protein